MSFVEQTKFWNERFNKEEFIFGKEPNVYLVNQAIQYLKPGYTVLCIADGEGRNGVWLAKQGMHVDAFDVSDIALAKAKKLAKDNSVEIRHTLCDTDGWIWQANAYDAIVAIFIQFADRAMLERIFKQVHLALKPGGIFILQGYTPKQLEYKTGGPSLLEHLYTEEGIRQLASELNILDLNSYEQELSEGARHSGMSALLGLVAQKPK